VHTLKEQVDVPRYIPGDGPPPTIRLRHRLRIRPGEYVVNAVLSDPRATSPLAATRPAIVTTIPKETLFLVGPLLGTAGASFEPALDLRTTIGEVLNAQTSICRVGADSNFDVQRVERSIADKNGRTTFRFPSTNAVSSDGRKVQCHTMLDHIETEGLAAGEYDFSVHAVSDTRTVGQASSSFRVIDE